jgi:protein-S-isoprenylcysteine O-methyltransferase Ste14
MALNRQALAFTVIPLVLLFGAIVVAPPAEWDALRIAGLVLAVLGFLLLTVARAQLGRSFSVTPQARQLVTTGLYRRIRNPVYVFGTVCLFGFVLFAHMPKVLWLVLLLIPLQVVRARAEARTLERKFGDDYRAWKRQTWF